jgi:hypothetical protein
VRSTTYIDDVEERFWAIIAENISIASNVVIVGVREAPCTRGRSRKGQLQQQRLYSKSLSSAAEVEAGEGFSVEVQIYRIEVLLGVFPRTQFTALQHTPILPPA